MFGTVAHRVEAVDAECVGGFGFDESPEGHS